MNIHLLTAGILIVVLVLVHAIAGEFLVNRPLFRCKSVPKLFGSEAFFRETIWMVWHILDVLGLGIAVIIFHIGSHPSFSESDVLILKTLIVVLLACGVMGVVFTKFKHISWIAFFAVAGLLFLSFK